MNFKQLMKLRQNEPIIRKTDRKRLYEVGLERDILEYEQMSAEELMREEPMDFDEFMRRQFRNKQFTFHW